MPVDALMLNATVDTVGKEVSLRIVGTQFAPSKMSIQVAITGSALVQIQGRLHRDAPWADIGGQCGQSCLIYIEPVWGLRAVSSATAPGASVSAWAAWSI